MRHYAEVASLSTSGRDADAVARHLAARGLTCKRLRMAILRSVNVSPDPTQSIPPKLDLSSGPSGDADFAALEHLASALMTDHRGVPPLLLKLIGVLRHNAAHRAAELGETAEQVIHSYVVSALSHLMGGEFYNGEALEAAFSLDRGSVTAELLNTMNTHLRFSMAELDDAYRTVPLEKITAMARLLTEQAPVMLRHLNISGVKLAEIEELAVVMAPAFVYFAELVRTAFDDFSSELTEPAILMRELEAAALE